MRSQEIRFCTSADGTRIAYAVTGSGMPLVWVASWLTHLEQDWRSCLRRPELIALSALFRLIRYDARDSGLSDADVERISLDAWVEDLAAVIDATGLQRVPLVATGEGGAVAIRYAATHPERVSHLVLLGSFALGRARRTPSHRGEVEAAATMIRYLWGEPHSGLAQMWTARLIPDGTDDQRHALDDLQRWSVRPRAALRSYRTATDLDVRDEARAVTTPALVLHALGDAMVPFDCGRELSSLLPDAAFVPLRTNNHILLHGEPSWNVFLEQLRSFLGRIAPRPGLDTLTRRELELVELVATGLDNTTIARQLVISPHTVRNHISHVFAKLGVRTRAEAIVLARDCGLGMGEHLGHRHSTIV